MTKITLIGYGKMGQAIDSIAEENGVEIVARVDPKHPKAEWQELLAKAVEECDICIDFTKPEEVINNIKLIGKHKKNVVIGTTGWYDKLSEVKELADQYKIGIFYSDNFSIGMHLFKQVVSYASNLINDWPHYDIALLEKHHKNKLDSPSGTALALTDILLNNIERKKKITTDSLDRAPNENELHVQSLRCGSLPGTHQVIIDSPADTIKLEHQARNRLGFALGALITAKWLENKTGVYTMEDFFA